MANLKVSEQAYPSTRYTEAAAPSTPASGEVIIYAKSDGLLYSKDDAGAESSLANAVAGTVATDAIWDTAGDLAVGTGANTAAKLVIGNAGATLARINGAVAWNASTSFPTATTGDRFFRTDLGQEFYYDGTRWVSTQVHKSQLLMVAGSTVTTTETGDLTSTLAATKGATKTSSPSLLGGSNIWLVDHRVTFIVNSGGTALGASHKWVGTFTTRDSTATLLTTHATVNIDSGSSAVYRVQTTAIGALQDATTFFYQGGWSKTGTPGTLALAEEFTYRIVAT
jgi:hypothetical protein